jgi:hypothetical protein
MRVNGIKVAHPTTESYTSTESLVRRVKNVAVRAQECATGINADARVVRLRKPAMSSHSIIPAWGELIDEDNSSSTGRICELAEIQFLVGG